MRPGKLIRNIDEPEDSIFGNAIVLIIESNDNGETGFIINKPSARRLNELTEFRHSKPFPLHEGGPVDQQHLYLLHRRPDLIPGGKPVTDDIYSGGDFKEVIKHINNGSLTEKDLKLFLGYCGWDKDELANEEGWVLTSGKSIF